MYFLLWQKHKIAVQNLCHPFGGGGGRCCTPCVCQALDVCSSWSRPWPWQHTGEDTFGLSTHDDWRTKRLAGVSPQPASPPMIGREFDMFHPNPSTGTRLLSVSLLKSTNGDAQRWVWIVLAVCLRVLSGGVIDGLNGGGTIIGKQWKDQDGECSVRTYLPFTHHYSDTSKI